MFNEQVLEVLNKERKKGELPYKSPAVAQQFCAHHILNVNHHSNRIVSLAAVIALAQAREIIGSISGLWFLPNNTIYFFPGFHPKAAGLIVIRPKFGVGHRLGALSQSSPIKRGNDNGCYPELSTVFDFC
jgi:hypothetical protein